MMSRVIPLAALLVLSACEPEPASTVATKPRPRSHPTAAPADEPALLPAEPSPPPTRPRNGTDQEIDRIMLDSESHYRRPHLRRQPGVSRRA